MSPRIKCRLVGYIRVSGKKQGESGLGLEGQVKAIADHAQASGCTLVATYREVESGKKSDRPQLALALAHAKRLKATLVIAKIDRLARNVAFVANLMESKVPFVACDLPAANDLTIHILAAVAQDEAKRVSDRTKAALAAAKARGVVLGAPHHLTREGTLLGSKRGTETIQRNRAEAYAHILPAVKKMRAKGMSLQAIADELTDMGEETRTGKAWNPMQVSRLLKD